MSFEADKSRRACKRKCGRPPAAAPAAPEHNNNVKRARGAKEEMLAAYQPWVIRTYGDLAKTKTVTLKKYARILRTLRGDEVVSADNSKFRFWVKAKGFCVGRPPGYDARPADGIVGRYSVCDVDGGIAPLDGKLAGSARDPPLYVPNVSFKNTTGEPVYRKVAVVENFFDIIYNVHVDLEGRPGKHAGQKRTYRTITETYAFLPREAVTRFLLGCTECQKRPPPPSPSPPPLPPAAAQQQLQQPPPHSLLPTPSPSPTPPAAVVGATAKAAQSEAKISTVNTRSSGRQEHLKNNSHAILNNHHHPTNNNKIQTTSPLELQPQKDPRDELYSVNTDRTQKSQAKQAAKEVTKEEKKVRQTSDRSTESRTEYKESEKRDGENRSSHRSRRDVEEQNTRNKYCGNPLDVINLTTPKSTRSSEAAKNKIWSPFKSIDEDRQRRPVYGREATLPHDIDYSMPITTTYLKYMRSLGFREEDAFNFNGNHVSVLLEQFMHEAVSYYYHY